MQLDGQIHMMKASLVEGRANYSLTIGEDTVDMNSLIGSPIKLTFAGSVAAIRAGYMASKGQLDRTPYE